MTTYVYGITAVPVELPAATGVGDVPVRAVIDGPVAAVVSDAGDGPLRATAAGLKAHSRVLDQLAADTTVLPLRFGTALPDDDAVVEDLLRPHRDRFTGLLSRLDGHVQLTVKVFLDEEAVLRDVVRRDRGVATLWRRVKDVPAEAAYYDRIALGQEIARAVQERSAASARPLLEQLVPLSADSRTNEPAQELMVVDADFLVARDRLGEFDAAVDALARSRPQLQFKYLGPMPPYSFADVVLQGA